jgi:hypothetical protein
MACRYLPTDIVNGQFHSSLCNSDTNLISLMPANVLPPSSVDVKNEGSYTSTTPTCLRGVERDNFDFQRKLSFPVAQKPKSGLSCLLSEAFRSHLDTPHSVGLLWTSDQFGAETSTWQHTTLTKDKHPWPQWDSNPRSQQSVGRRPTP